MVQKKIHFNPGIEEPLILTFLPGGSIKLSDDTIVKDKIWLVRTEPLEENIPDREPK